MFRRLPLRSNHFVLKRRFSIFHIFKKLADFIRFIKHKNLYVKQVIKWEIETTGEGDYTLTFRGFITPIF